LTEDIKQVEANTVRLAIAYLKYAGDEILRIEWTKTTGWEIQISPDTKYPLNWSPHPRYGGMQVASLEGCTIITFTKGGFIPQTIPLVNRWTRAARVIVRRRDDGVFMEYKGGKLGTGRLLAEERLPLGWNAESPGVQAWAKMVAEKLGVQE
jgi:hypothetical protein